MYIFLKLDDWNSANDDLVACCNLLREITDCTVRSLPIMAMDLQQLQRSQEMAIMETEQAGTRKNWMQQTTE
jgi:hypothetical protein